MSNKRYIEIYSLHRDRKLYPFVSDFVVPLEQTGLRNTSTTAVDPIINAFPSYTFALNTASSTPATTPVGPAAGPKTFSGGNRFTPILENSSSNIDNFYNGYHLIDTTINETRTILSYNAATQAVTLDYPFGPTWAATDNYNIVDPSIPFDTVVIGAAGSVAGTAANPILTFYASVTPTPNFAAGGFPAGYFIGYDLQLLDLNGNVKEERTIQDFIPSGGTTYTVDLDNAFSALSWPPLGTDYFRITFPPLPQIHLQPVDIFNFSNPANYSQFYTGQLVFNELTGEAREIIKYNATTRIATLNKGFSSLTPFSPLNATVPPYASALLSIRNDVPLVVSTFAAPGSTIGQNIVYLDPATSPDQDDFWNGKYIYIRPYAYSFTNIPSEKNIYKINKYYGGANPYAVLDKALELDALTGNTYEIMNFTKDNFAPMCYTGSTVSQNELVCYEIELLSLVLPNVVLTAGSRISFYPFVYVQFGTFNSSMNHSNCVFYSNNPDANTALFICPTTDVSNPLTSQFIKLDGQKTVQTVKFKPNDNLKFRVFLPNGELFLPLTPDNYSPLPPNILLQVEAMFSIKRLTTS